MTVFIEHPWLALLPAILFLVLWWATRSRTVLTAAILWAAYAAWEFGVGHAGPDADIRVDLLVIYPLLAVITVAAAIAAVRRRKR